MHPNKIIELYSMMHGIRVFEENLLEIYSRGLIKGTVHTCIGQEACAVGVIAAIDPKVDSVCSNHRGHGHFLAFGGSPTDLLNEILGNDNGVCNGVGGSQHLHINNFYSNGILGGMTPVATGIALSKKIKNLKEISVVFIGDGAMAEGVVYESLNIAALWKLPLLLVIENNKIAQSTSVNMQHATSIETIPAACGILTIAVDGNNVISVFSSAQRLITEIRDTNEPRCLVLNTYRLGPHSKGDDTRSKEEMIECRKFDPIELLENQIPRNIFEEIQKNNVLKLNEINIKCGVTL